MYFRNKIKNCKGFTFIELVMVIILTGIIAASLAIPLSQGIRGWFQATTREGISQSGRMGIERMAREIRNTAKTAANIPCVSSATATAFRFSDITGNLTNCNTTEFSLSGVNIQRITRDNAGAIIETANLSDNVTAFTITYYDRNNATPPAVIPDNICRLSIEITSSQGGEILRKYEEVYLPNMRSVCTP